MRPPSTATGLALILLVVAALPLGALAMVSAGAVQERAEAHAETAVENAALHGAICVATLMEQGAAPAEALRRAGCVAEGVFLVSPDGERTGARGRLPPDPGLAARVGESPSGTAQWRGATVSWARVPGQNLVLVMGHPAAAVAPPQPLGVPLAAWGAGLLAGGVGLLSLALARRWISNPLAAVARASERVAAGDDDERAPVAGTAEIAALARAFNAMAAEVTSKRRGLESANARLAAQARTRRRQLERAAEDLEAFTFTVDHELREPLRSLETLVGVALEQPAEGMASEERDLFETVRRRTARLQSISRDLLRYDDVARNRHPVDAVCLDLALDEALERVAPLLEARGARVERDSALPEVRGNHALLVDLLAELLENGVTYNDSDAPAVVVGAEPVAGGVARVWVEDNGIGVPRDRREEAFHLFQRLHPVGRYSEGTGVGLALARRVARAHDGDLTVADATVGEGSRFTLALPVAGPWARPELPAPQAAREF